jgi:diguanylate cyclase (GGDEF)-like protein
MPPSPAKPATGKANFDAPPEATPLTNAPSWAFLVLITAAGVFFAATRHDGAFWATPYPLASAIALSIFVACASAVVTYRTTEGLTEDASLAMPLNFALLILFDWRYFVFATALGEALIFISEWSRKKSPTVWYIRTYNPCALVVAGAAAETTIHALESLLRAPFGIAWLGIGPSIALFAGALVWKIVHNLTDSTLITLAAGRSIAAVRVPPGVFLSQFALFLIAVPFARMWSFNPWLSLFSLAPVVMSYRLLQLPELEYRATTDGRTGLKNAEAFDRILSDAVEASVATGRDLVLLAIDIDHFKNINDTYGHLVGDGVIAGFAGILAGEVRKDDVVARTGGEEFALLMQGADREAALAFAERVRDRIEAHDFEGIGLAAPIKVTASIGVAFFPEDGLTTTELSRAADAALYRAKREGRNAVRAAETEFTATFVPPTAWHAEIDDLEAARSAEAPEAKIT